MKKILFFIAERGAGTGSMFVQQAIALSRLKKVEFLFISGGTEKEQGLFNDLEKANARNVKISGLEYHNDFQRLVKEFIGIVRKFSPEIVHVQTNWQLAIAIAGKFLGNNKFKIFYTVHGFRNNSVVKSFLFRMVLGFFLWLFVEKLIVCSSYVKKKFSFLSKKIKIIYLGVDDIYFDIEREDDQKINKGVSIFYPAAFRKGKKQELLINTVARLSKKYNDITLYLPGGGENINRCKDLAESLDIADKVKFPGFLYKHELLGLLQNCNLAIIPSVSETFGHCIAEPFVTGKCIVSRSVGIANDVIKSGINGYIFDDDEELYALIDMLLANREKLTQMGDKAFENRNIFKWDVIAAEYEKFIIG